MTTIDRSSARVRRVTRKGAGLGDDRGELLPVPQLGHHNSNVTRAVYVQEIKSAKRRAKMEARHGGLLEATDLSSAQQKRARTQRRAWPGAENRHGGALLGENRLVAGPRSPAAHAAVGLADAEALRAGDEQRFAELVRCWSGPMLRLAQARVGSRAVAEEVVQDAWMTVVRDLDRFEGRSALRTWVLGIVSNLARARARAERRAVPVPPERADGGIDPARFRPADAREWPDHWRIGPIPWPGPEDALLAGEACRVILQAIEALPPAQREVLVLRDLEGLSGGETCVALGLTQGNARVLLHRARTRVRASIEYYFDATEPT